MYEIILLCFVIENKLFFSVFFNQAFLLYIYLAVFVTIKHHSTSAAGAKGWSPLAGEEPFLLFANRHDLRQLHLYSGNYHLLVDGQKSIIALDYDYSNKLLFWSDVATERISM